MKPAGEIMGNGGLAAPGKPGKTGRGPIKKPMRGGIPTMGRATASERGQSLVEFSLVLPMFLLLLIGIAEFGRAWMTRNILTGAAREAVRIAAVQGSPASATARANTILSSAGIKGASVVLSDDGAAYGICGATVSYNFPLTVAGFLPGLSGTSIPLNSSTSMRKEF